ncbi:MAG TPA: ExeM/NucH family extracellular endonuclease, partial [Actinomycetales bacterium]|nr:ExeM/NucH family extracellular endonuclease [Actinomycetales bacterium]
MFTTLFTHFGGNAMKSTQKPFYLLMVLALLAGLLGFQPAQPAEAALPADLFFSEYIEGGSMNKAIEIYNGTGADVDLTGYDVELYSNGSPTVSKSVTLTGTLLNGDVYVIANSGADQDILDETDLQDNNVANWNGDDAIVLKDPDGSILDVFGVIDEDPGTSWGTGDYTTHDHTLVRDPDICGGDPDGTDAFDPSIEWISFAKDTTTEIGSHTSNCAPDFFPERFIISEYVEGSGNNKAIELYNGTGVDVDLQDYYVSLYSNGGSVTPTSVLSWTGETILPAGETYVVVNSAASETLKTYADTIHGITAFNGNDTLVLFEVASGAPIVRDSFGQLGFDPGTAWVSGDISTVNQTLVRKANVCSGDTVPDDVFDPALEYDSYTIDTYSNLGSHTMTCGPADQAPTVLSTVPANGADTVAVDANIIITFSEPVIVTGDWFTISCTESGTHTAAVTNAGPEFTLVPDPVFATGETCTVTVLADNVTDNDTEDPPDNMEANYVFTFDTVEACGDPFTAIYAIQGSGDTSPLVGQTVTTEGIVVGDFQDGGKNGFFIQDETGDGNDATSDGIFVYYKTAPDVNVGDKLRLTGSVSEYYGATQITGSSLQLCSTGNSIAPTPVSLPVTTVDDFEKYEGMLVTFPQSLIISEYFNFDRYGEIVLTSDRHMTPTALVEPGPDAVAAAQAYLLDRITLDDGRTSQNPDPAIHPNGLEFTMDNLFRGGGTVAGVTGVMDYDHSLYRVQLTEGGTYVDANPRTTEPDIIESDLKIASFNVLNYFVTLDNGPDICGPSGTLECRGADDAEEFTRQKAKIVAAMAAINADIFGLMEIENDRLTGEGDAVADLVAGINAIAGTDTYAYIDTGAIGTDAIKQAIIYKPNSVTPVGDYHILDSSVDSRFIDTKNRPVIAQVFEDNETGEQFVVAVNHLKSKGSCPEPGDDYYDEMKDIGDGQSCWSPIRLAAAEAMVEWLANPTYFPDVEKKLIIGDLNSYDKEDPIDAIKLGSDDTADTEDDYLDLIFELRGDDAYGYVFDGQTGYLDHALANLAMAENIVDVNFWHINADEPDMIDYDMSFKEDAQDDLYAPDAYRSSDHDPVIVALEFNEPPVAQDQQVTTDEDTSIDITSLATDPEDDDLTYVIVGQPANGTVALSGDKATYTPNLNFHGSDSFTYKAYDGELYSEVVTVTLTINAINDAPVAEDDAYDEYEDNPIEILARGLLANDSDVDGDSLTVDPVAVAEPQNGVLVLGTDGSFTYTPNADFNGTDSFSYKVLDGNGGEDVGVVTITITPVNDAPVADDQSLVTDQDTPVAIVLTAEDVDDDAITWYFYEPKHGTLTGTAPNLTYTPAAGFYGEDSFTFTVDDGKVSSNLATVTITVNPVNDAPVALADTYSTDQDTDLVVAAPGVLGNDTDVDEDALTAVVVDDVTSGTLDLAADGSFTYTPEAGFVGEDSFTYKAFDG